MQYWLSIFPSGILIGYLLGAWAGALKVKYNLPVGYSRKIFHFSIFTLATVIGAIGGFPAVQVFGAAMGLVVGYAVLQGEKSNLYLAIARPTDAPYQKYYIIMPFLMTALGGMVSNILFGECALIGYIAAGWGDAVGEPVGTRWGKHKYRVPDLSGLKVYRSIEGSLGVFLASFLGCGILFYTGFHYGGHLYFMIYVAALIAFITAIVEAVTFHSLDNFTIQVITSAAGFMILMKGIAN